MPSKKVVDAEYGDIMVDTDGGLYQVIHTHQVHAPELGGDVVYVWLAPDGNEGKPTHYQVFHVSDELNVIHERPTSPTEETTVMEPVTDAQEGTSE